VLTCVVTTRDTTVHLVLVVVLILAVLLTFG
jgi:hypothetical protein